MAAAAALLCVHDLAGGRRLGLVRPGGPRLGGRAAGARAAGRRHGERRSSHGWPAASSCAKGPARYGHTTGENGMWGRPDGTAARQRVRPNRSRGEIRYKVDEKRVRLHAFLHVHAHVHVDVWRFPVSVSGVRRHQLSRGAGGGRGGTRGRLLRVTLDAAPPCAEEEPTRLCRARDPVRESKAYSNRARH